jgi:hypothetical protein
MHRSLLVATLLLAPLAEAGTQSCLDTGHAQFIIDETLLGIVNPEGFENQLRAARCTPMFDVPGILFDYASWEVGFFNIIGPIYVHQGAYLDVVPLSFLELKVAGAGVEYWPLPLDGAGYFPLEGYTTHYKDTDLGSTGRAATGANATFTATLRGEVPLWGPHALYFADSLSADYWYLEGGDYYFNARRDVVLKKSDWVVNNYATLLLELRPTEKVGVHVGLVDDLNYVPASGYLANIVGVIASVPIRRSGTVRDIEPFVRAAIYTHHAYRSGVQVLFGVSLDWAMLAP